ncbi:O-acyltransferase like protein-like [Drosophila ficusphila]|uniref:O-acyltransferase like protein-like n=1 Tax=Drosophila ficusphila TaxID=30025 RepID=UPI0007E6E166|nr:O-acyltransferase like protein-like [Drosophila ficusphila]
MARPSVIIWLSIVALGSVNGNIDNMFAVPDKPVPIDDLAGNYFLTVSKLRSLAVEFFDHYSNFTLADLYPNDHETRLPSAEDVRCLVDLALLSKDLASFKLWALKMIDSWGLLPSGLLVGNFWDLGNFEECLGIDHAVTTGYSVRGKYCFSKFAPVSSLSSLATIKTAVCFPASCSATHMDSMLRTLFQRILGLEISADVQIVDEATCQTAEKTPYDGLTIFTIVSLSTLAALVGLCTLIDYLTCQDEKPLNPVAKAFSARANSRVLFRLASPKSNPNVIDCLHGIRCLSFIYVVFCHDYLVFAKSPIINMAYVLTWFDGIFNQFVRHGIYAVDTFFFLSGLLLVVIALRSMEKTKGKLNIPLMYLHRYLRLTPVLAFAILIYLKILPLVGKGPLMDSASFDDYSSCADTWYWTLLYVQNYATSRMCLSHSWYLAVDMQLYIFAPFLLICLYKWGKKAAAGIFILMLLLASCLFSTMVIKNVSFSQGEKSQRILYYATNNRASPYLVGILFGYFLHINRGREFKLNWFSVLLGWLTSLALIFTCVFAVFGQNSLPIVEEAFYVTLTRIAWPLALCWVVFACMQGYGGPAAGLLSSPLWQPLSKLSYSAYVLHMFIETLNAGIAQTSIYFSDYQVMLRFWADFGFTMLLSFLMHILVEAPFAGLESLLLPTKRPTPKIVEAKMVDDKVEELKPTAPEETHVEESPVGKSQVGESPVGEPSVGESLVGESPVGKSLVGESPVGESPVGESPVGASLVGESLVGESPVGKSSVGESPVG